jgi:hypothetical protein
VTVPRRFVGAWERESLSIGGVSMPGAGRAVWIEAGGVYVDVRAPGTVASGTSFGGQSSWRSPMFTWRHDVDLHPRPGTVDRGALTLDDDRITERGTGVDGIPAQYEEWWRRLPAVAGRATAVAINAHGLAVRVDDYAALLVASPAPAGAGARLWEHANGAWVETITLGDPGATPRPHGSGWRLTRGWSALSYRTMRGSATA